MHDSYMVNLFIIVIIIYFYHYLDQSCRYCIVKFNDDNYIIIMQKRIQSDSEFQHTYSESVDMKQLRDSPIKDAQNCTRMEK